MARKDITDLQVCEAYRDSWKSRQENILIWPEQLLMERTGESEKVCFSAMERAEDHDLIEYGVSLRSGWLTEKGKELLGA